MSELSYSIKSANNRILTTPTPQIYRMQRTKCCIRSVLSVPVSVREQTYCWNFQVLGWVHSNYLALCGSVFHNDIFPDMDCIQRLSSM